VRDWNLKLQDVAGHQVIAMAGATMLLQMKTTLNTQITSLTFKYRVLVKY
jgi:hypothetical protein